MNAVEPCIIDLEGMLRRAAPGCTWDVVRGDAVGDSVEKNCADAVLGSVSNAGSVAIDGMVSDDVGNDNGGKVPVDVVVGSRGWIRWQAGQLPVKLWSRIGRWMAMIWALPPRNPCQRSAEAGY